MEHMIRAEGLKKRFGKTQALAGVDILARRGTVLGVLGPNGEGTRKEHLLMGWHALTCENPRGRSRRGFWVAG
jgi:ABC-type branched-subunit amino acid transport system ATPase component